MMTNFIMMVGISGSGKSTLAKQYADLLGYKIVSSDAIRQELYGSEDIQDNHQKVFDIADKRVIEYLKNGDSVILDATNLKKKFRTSLLNKLKPIEGIYKECYVILPNIEVSIDNQKNRKRQVSTNVILKQSKQFEMPTTSEGFDEVNIIQ